MSRSLHTQPLALRASRRLARPHSRRRAEAAFLSGRATREISARLVAGKRLRLRMSQPLPGTLHPLCARDLRERLARLGPTAAYGLQSIRLRRECAFAGESFVFAEYVVPGHIELYAVPESPWYLPFIPSPEDQAAFVRHGARLRVDTLRQQTTVEWTLPGLKSFLLSEVLAHELGHHRLQYNKGKRLAVVCRRRDHEQCAERYCRRTREDV